MRKNLFFVVLFVTMLTIGCGKSATATDRYTVGSNNSQSNDSLFNNGSKSEATLNSSDSSADTNIENGSSKSPSTENSSINVDNTGHEPDHYGTGNFQDYWEGDDFFDLKAYAIANGCTSFTYTTDDWSLTKDEAEAMFYILHIEDKVKIYLFDIGATVTMKDGLEYNIITSFKTKIWEDHFTEETEKEKVHISKKNSARLSLTALKELDVVLKCIKNYDYNGSDLLKDSGIHYIIDDTRQHLE